MKRLVVSFVLASAFAVGATALGGCSSCSRFGKTVSSDFGGGLNRTVTAYDFNGNVLGKWSGKFDISESDNEIFFDDADGKRVIIQNAIVIAEEE